MKLISELAIALVAIICCSCSKQSVEKNSLEEKRPSLIANVAKANEAKKKHNVRIANVPKKSYWKDPDDKHEIDDEVVLDIMTQSLVDDLKFAINDFDLDDKTRVNALVKLSKLKCKRSDFKEAFSSIALLPKDIRKETISEIIESGIPASKRAIREVVEEVIGGEDEAPGTWVEFLEQTKDGNDWTNDVADPDGSHDELGSDEDQDESDLKGS